MDTSGITLQLKLYVRASVWVQGHELSCTLLLPVRKKEQWLNKIQPWIWVKDSDSLPGRSFEGAVTFLLAKRQMCCGAQNGTSWGNINWTTRNVHLNHIFIVTPKGAGSQDNLEFAQNKWISSKKYTRWSPKCFQQQRIKIFRLSRVSTTSMRSACTARAMGNSRGSFSSPLSICRCVYVSTGGPRFHDTFLITSSHRPRPRPSTGTPKAGVERLPARPTFHLLEIITGE